MTKHTGSFFLCKCLVIVACLNSYSTFSTNAESAQITQLQNEKAPLVISSLSSPWDKHLSIISPVAVPTGIIYIVGTSLHLFDNTNHLIWQVDAKADINDVLFIKESDILIVIAMDLTWFGIDVHTGKEKWNRSGNGRATYTQIKEYKDGMYLVVTAMAGYDWDYMECLENHPKDSNRYCKQTQPDRISLCKDKETFEERDFPPNSNLKVINGKVMALSTQGRKLIVQEINFSKLPSNKGSNK